jgi:hypothetical protein
MNSVFWEKVGLLLFILATIGWFTDFSVLNLRWAYLPMIAIGVLLYIAPAEYYALKGKKGNEK